MTEHCIQCRRTADELGHGRVLMYRDPPWPSVAPGYKACLECAKRIRDEQDQRAQEAIRVAKMAGV